MVYTADSIRKFDSKSNQTADSIRDSIRTQKNDSQLPIIIEVFRFNTTNVTNLPLCHEKAWSVSSDIQGPQFLAVVVECGAPAVSERRHEPLCKRRGFCSAWQVHTACYFLEVKAVTGSTGSVMNESAIILRVF